MKMFAKKQGDVEKVSTEGHRTLDFTPKEI